MSIHLDPREADRLRRAESRWLEQARERLRHPAGRHPQTPSPLPQADRSEETDR